MLRGYPAGLLTILGMLNKPSRGVSKSLRKDLGSFQKSAASFVIRSVLVNLLFMLQSPVAVIITSPVAAKEQQSETVLDKFDSFFRVRRNVIYECARFNRRNQLENETAEQYIMELYRLAERCDYGALRDEMIRDRLLVGIRDTALSQQLQLDAELTLEKAKKRI